ACLKMRIPSPRPSPIRWERENTRLSSDQSEAARRYLHPSTGRGHLNTYTAGCEPSSLTGCLPHIFRSALWRALLLGLALTSLIAFDSPSAEQPVYKRDH